MTNCTKPFFNLLDNKTTYYFKQAYKTLAQFVIHPVFPFSAKLIIFVEILHIKNPKIDVAGKKNFYRRV